MSALSLLSKKSERKTKTPRRKHNYIIHDQEINAEELNVPKGRKEMGEDDSNTNRNYD